MVLASALLHALHSGNPVQDMYTTASVSPSNADPLYAYIYSAYLFNHHGMNNVYWWLITDNMFNVISFYCTLTDMDIQAGN